MGVARTCKLVFGHREVFPSCPAQASTWSAEFAPDLEAAMACSTEDAALLLEGRSALQTAD